MSLNILWITHNTDLTWTFSLGAEHDNYSIIDVYVDGKLYLRETTSPVTLSASKYEPIIDVKLSSDALYSIPKSMMINNKSLTFRGDTNATEYILYRAYFEDPTNIQIDNAEFQYVMTVKETRKGYYTIIDSTLHKSGIYAYYILTIIDNCSFPNYQIKLYCESPRLTTADATYNPSTLELNINKGKSL